MAKRGPSPSLIGGSQGGVTFAEAKRRRTCKRCNGGILKGESCAEISIPGKQGHRTYCLDCFEQILGKTERDLNNLREELEDARRVARNREGDSEGQRPPGNQNLTWPANRRS